MGYEVTSSDGTVDVVEGADSYGQEGPLTTFFATGPGRAVVDSWSTRLASYRTADIVRVRLVDDVRAPDDARVLSGSISGAPPAGRALSPSSPPRWA
jgi:hypothetical protein